MVGTFFLNLNKVVADDGHTGTGAPAPTLSLSF